MKSKLNILKERHTQRRQENPETEPIERRAQVPKNIARAIDVRRMAKKELNNNNKKVHRIFFVVVEFSSRNKN